MSTSLFRAAAFAIIAAVCATSANAQPTPQVATMARRGISPPMRDAARNAVPDFARAPFAIPNKLKRFGPARIEGPEVQDPIVQTVNGPAAAATVQTGFDGGSDDDNAAFAGFRVVPPDTEGDVGPNHYVQWINLIAQVFDKNGTSLVGPVPGSAIFAGGSGACATDNDGDPQVLYDEQADRWLLAQFAVSSGNFMCFAVSTSPDPTGTYYLYALDFGSDFPDYPKLGIWGDSYTLTTRDFFAGAIWRGQSAIAIDRNAMLSGLTASSVRFTNAFGQSSSDGVLPADADTPVAGPAVFAGHGDDGDTNFELWELDVDWANPGAASLSPVRNIPISSFDGSTPSANQPNGQVLDALPYFTMHRLNVRNFGTHISMVANHTVEASPGVLGVRWYEFRNTGGPWFLYQEGTYSPDSDDRWMGSIAINANGDISLGYSRSSSTMFPSIYATGQTAAQSGTGVMDVGESLLRAGSGSQVSYSRWGDYSKMAVDPTTDSFWYTAEYYQETASFDFKTWIAEFDLGDGGGGDPPGPATTMHVASLVTETADAGKGQKRGQATVSIRDDLGFPVPGADLVVQFSGTFNEVVPGSTDQNGVAVVQTEGTAKRGVSVSACVQSVADTASLTYEPDQNADPAYACELPPDPPGEGTSVHIASIVTGTESAGAGNKHGTATVELRDDQGNSAGPGYTVTGNFSGDISDLGVIDDTDAAGVASFVTSGTARGGVSVSFCVTSVTGGGLPYVLNDNTVATYDCSVAGKGGVASASTPADFALDQNYPNPFNPVTIISYSVAEAGPVSMRVYNVLGQEVARLVGGYREAGQHRVAFDASRLSAGLYVYVLEAGDYSATKRMTLLK